MKILLINPSKYDATGTIEKYRRGSLPPLNLVLIASLIRDPDVEVKIVDEYLEDIPFDEPFDLVGITTLFTCTFPRVVDISARFRGRGIPVVLGGTHATCCRDTAIAHADAIVLGEAEGKIEELIADLRAGQGLKKFYGGDFVDLEKAAYHEPRYDRINLSRYAQMGLLHKSNVFVIESSRGCPMSCTFCTVGVTHGRKTRFRAIAAVIEDIRFLKRRYGARFFAFADDNFTINPDYSKALLQEIAREDIRFHCELSMAIFKHPELVESLARAGCVSGLMGIESVDEKNLASVHKGSNRPSDYRELFALFKRNRVSAMAAMIFGFDHDDPDVFLRTVNFLKECNVPRTLLTILTPVPGTVLYQELDRDGRLFDRDFSHYDGAHTVYQPKKMTPAELEEGLWTAYRAFYDLPSIAWRTLNAGSRSALYTLIANWRFRQLVYHRLYPYNSGAERIN